MPKYTPMYKPSGAGPMLVLEGDEKRYEDMGWTRSTECKGDIGSSTLVKELLVATRNMSLEDIKNLTSVKDILGMLSDGLQSSSTQ